MFFIGHLCWWSHLGRMGGVAGYAGDKKQNAQRPSSKRRRGGEPPAPFCCPSPQVMEFDLDLCGGIYPEGARHNGLLCEPEGRELLPARTLCIRRRYVGYRHTQQLAQPIMPCQNSVRVRHVQATTAPAACERRALDGVAAFGGAMKREVVKRLRQRSGRPWQRS